MKPIYTVWATMQIEVTTEIRADDLDDAVAQCKELSIGDFFPKKFTVEDYDNFEIKGLLK